MHPPKRAQRRFKHGAWRQQRRNARNAFDANVRVRTRPDVIRPGSRMGCWPNWVPPGSLEYHARP
eukprot:7553294-Alexandrium_andersonii.AAC.1